MNKLILTISFLLSFPASAADHHVFQIGKTFVSNEVEGKFSLLKNGRGRFIKKKVEEYRLTTISIKAGDTVHFHNNDNVVHNVFGKEFDLHQEKNSIKKRIFHEKGTRIIRCAIHPKMKLKIEVE